MILPQIEENALFDAFNLDVNVLQQPNEPQAQQIASMLCPSDNAIGRYYQSPRWTGNKRFAKANYAAYCGPYHVDLQHYFPGALISTGSEGQQLRSVTDGTGQTIALAEIRTRDHERDQRGAWALPWTATSLLTFDMHHAGSPGQIYVPAEYSLGLTQPPNAQGWNDDVLYECPDPNRADLEGMPCNDFYDSWLSAAPRSLHPGGVNVAYLDGRTKFLHNEVEEYLMAYLVCSNDGRTAEEGVKP